MKAAQQAESALSKSDASSSRYVTLSQCIGDSHYRLASFYQKSAFGSDVSNYDDANTKVLMLLHYYCAV